METAVIAEFKVRDNYRDKLDVSALSVRAWSYNQGIRSQNEEKITKGATEIMADDPRRRFVPGITIEKHTLRFWLFSRSHVAVSEAVDFHKVR